jgi:hypothetical protein
MEVEAKTHVRRPAAASPPLSPAAPAAVESAPAAPRAVPRAAQAASLPERLLAWVDHHRRKLVAGVFVLYLLGFNGQWRLDADSALYLTIGRNIAEGRGYTYHGDPHNLAYPGMPWLFAGLFKVFGTNTLVPAQVVMLGCGLATLALTYRLFLLHAGRPTAVLITLVVGLSRTFYRYSFELLSDMPFLMGVMAFLVGYEAIFYRRYDRDVRGPGGYEPPPGEHAPDGRAKPRWYDALLLLGGLSVAMVTRPTMWALLAAVVGAVVLSLFTRPLRKGWVIVGLGFVAAAATAAVLFYTLDPRRVGGTRGAGDYELVLLDSITTRPGEIVQKMIRVNIPHLLHPGAAEAVSGVDWGHVDIGSLRIPLGPPMSVLSIGAGLLLFRRRLLWGMWVALSVVMMLVTLVQVRYFLQVLPLLLYGWWVAVVWLDGRLAGRRWGRRLAPTVFGVLVAVNVGRIASLIVEQRSASFLEEFRGGKYAIVPKLNELLRNHTPDQAWVLVPERQLGRILTYTSHRFTAEPGPVTTLDPSTQEVYVLQPMEPDTAEWMKVLGIGTGEPVGPPVYGRRGKAWQLHRATRTTPDPSALPNAVSLTNRAGKPAP